MEMPGNQEKPPPRLYKYQAFTARALVALKARTVWFGRASTLNDPYDCAVPFTVREISDEDCLRLVDQNRGTKWESVFSDPEYIDGEGRPTSELKKALKEKGEEALREQAGAAYWNQGVTCFSERPDDTLLWSHYGGGHRGLCLEFDSSSEFFDKMLKVRYADDIPEINVVDQLISSDDRFLLRILLTKASCWAYEREWRGIHVEADKEYCYGGDALTGVYLGARLTKSEKDLVGQILHGSPARLYQVHPGRMSFRLEAHPIQYEPYRFGECSHGTDQH